MIRDRALNCAARIAKQDARIIRDEQTRKCGPRMFASISGIVNDRLARIFLASKIERKKKPKHPEPNHQNAGVPALAARSIIPIVAEPPTQAASREKATAGADALRPRI